MILQPALSGKLLAELSNLPEWQRPEPETPKQVRERLVAHLRSVIVTAEAELTRLGRPQNAWQQVSAYLTDVLPVFGYGETANLMLGPLARRGSKGPLPTRQLHSFTEIERQAKRCPQCRTAIKGVPLGLLGHAMIVQAQRHHKSLFRRYLAELAKPIPAVFEEMPAWGSAYRAATAQEALKDIDSPMAVFAAGAYLERQEIIDYLLRTLPGERGNAVREAVASYKHNWRKKIGRKKVGKILPHTALVQAAVKHMRVAERPMDADTVLAVLTGEDADADQLLDEIRWELARVDKRHGGRQRQSGIELPDDSEPPATVECGTVFFRFKNRPDRKISLGRFRNMVSEARQKATR